MFSFKSISMKKNKVQDVLPKTCWCVPCLLVIMKDIVETDLWRWIEAWKTPSMICICFLAYSWVTVTAKVIGMITPPPPQKKYARKSDNGHPYLFNKFIWKWIPTLIYRLVYFNHLQRLGIIWQVLRKVLLITYSKYLANTDDLKVGYMSLKWLIALKYVYVKRTYCFCKALCILQVSLHYYLAFVVGWFFTVVFSSTSSNDGWSDHFMLYLE